MMRNILFITFLFFLFITSACQDRPKSELSPKNSTNTNFAKLSTEKPMEQVESNKVREILKKNKDLSTVHAINSDEQLLITIEINHLKRFQLENIRKDIENQMKREFSHLEVFVSTDQKIINEIKDFEEKMLKGKASKKQINEKIEQLIDLAKEET